MMVTDYRFIDSDQSKSPFLLHDAVWGVCWHRNMCSYLANPLLIHLDLSYQLIRF